MTGRAPQRTRAAGTIKRGDRFVVNGRSAPRYRLYITVTRVAWDQSWADIRVQTWAVMWTKRQPLGPDHRPPGAELYAWNQGDLDRQEADHMANLREKGILS